MNLFTHLHVHSHYTLLGATASPEELAQRAAAEGCTHLALTDTHALYGAVAFDRACRAAGVTPILGMAARVAWPAELAARPDFDTPGEVVLLATGPAGYRSLCRLSSQMQGCADREAACARGLTLDDLRANHAGLLCLDGGRLGWVARCLRAGEPALARDVAARLASAFPDRAYLALELHSDEDTALAHAAKALGTELGLPTVAVQPVYCLEPEERARLRLLAAIAHNCPLAEVPPGALPDGGDPRIGIHWLREAEIRRRFADFPGAVARTAELAARCEPALPGGQLLWPTLDLPAGQTPDDALTEQAYAGLAQRYPATNLLQRHPERSEGSLPCDAEISRFARNDDSTAVDKKSVQSVESVSHFPFKGKERLAQELAAITYHGYAPLFLIVADIVRHARSHDIPVSTRGSVANSLTAYCLGITTVDPLEHDLLFERFLNPGRRDPPDIDLDFCSRRRDLVLVYVRERYGADRVALVATISTLQPRSALRETAKALGLDDERIAGLMRNLPHGWHPRRRDEDHLGKLLETLDDPDLRAIVAAAMGVVNAPHHLSIHPGGVVITPGPLADTLPVQWAPKGFLITQFDHNDVEAVGLPKLDLLGIRALTVLADAADLVRRDADPGFRLDDIPLDDAETGALLARAETIGIFQCESEGARRTLRQLNAHTVRDLAVANAFFKPGPAMGGMADAFVRRYRGELEVAYMHPALVPILAHTQGVLIYQEQILRIATEIAGLSWEQAGYLRRGMSKMNPAEMDRMRTAFEAGCRRPAPDGPGFTADQARTLWEQVAAFSGYGFNQGHATAYADVSYRSAYLKTHYPAAFFAARLRDWGGYHHPAVYMAEAQRLGIGLRLPHVNHSLGRVSLAWEAEQPVIWLGLNLIRDLRKQSAARLVAERRRAPFADLREMLERVPLQNKEIAHLVQGGALDGLGENRAALLAEAGVAGQAGSSGARQMAFNFVREPVVSEGWRQRWQWEQRIVGYPWSALRGWLPELASQGLSPAPLRDVHVSGGSVDVLAVRLPGWGRGSYYLWDGESWAMAKNVSGLKTPPQWAPAYFRVRREQERRMAWLRVEQVEIL
ncbi:MAG: DNA polymerase III subunit alpha [Anaerolineae bacterium]|nr:DNA polymerase III subunit alpha [Anaerolineae bacterium]